MSSSPTKAADCGGRVLSLVKQFEPSIRHSPLIPTPDARLSDSSCGVPSVCRGLRKGRGRGTLTWQLAGDASSLEVALC